jgi:ribosomal protein L11 methyltransferase
VTVAERALDTFEPPDPDEGDPFPTLRIYFPSGAPEPLRLAVRALLVDLRAQFPGIEPTLPGWRTVADEDWASSWQQHFPPLRIGSRLLIRPSWSDEPPAPADIVLTLDPGRAFGTGTHATTSLCLEVVARLADGPRPPASVLDVGAGSGILALAAAALGAGTVLACEIDPEACQVAAENIAANGFSATIATTTTPLEQLPGGYDLVLANILAGENIRLAPALVAHLNPAGHLALSGILVEQEPQVLAAFAVHPLELVVIDRREEWSCLLYRRHG